MKPFQPIALAACGLAVVLTLSASVAHAQQEQAPTPVPSFDKARNAFQDALERIWVPQTRLTDGPHVRAAFRDAVSEPSSRVVEVRCGGKTVALGGIVGPDGWVLTKATQLDDDVRVRLKDKREFDAKVTGVSREYDLAMLKLDAQDLPALSLEGESTALDGDWVATVGTSRDPVAVGVMSVGPRKIPHRFGILGVQLEEADGGAMVAKVFPDSGAAQAGILVNDVLVSIDDQRTGSRAKLIEIVRRYSPGDVIEVGIRRNGKTLKLKAVLTGRNKSMRPPSRSEYQNNLGSTLSQRRFGFPSAFQHDTVLSAAECGGPVVNLDGQVIGFNIARAGRTESYAAPTSVVRELLFSLMSGKLAPEEGQPE